MEGVLTDAGIEAGRDKNRKVVVGDEAMFLVMRPKMISSGRTSTSHKTEQVEMTNQGFSCLCSDAGGAHRGAQWAVQQDASTQVSFVHIGQPEQLKLVTNAVDISTQCPSLCTWKQQSSANCDKTRARILTRSLKESPYMKVKSPRYEQKEITVGSKYRKRSDVNENIPTAEHNCVDNPMVHRKMQCYNQASSDKTKPGYDKQDKEITKTDPYLLKDSRKDARKRRKKIMVLGKLKCLQCGNYSKANKVAKPMSRYAHYINKNAVGDGYTKVNKKQALGSKGKVRVSLENAAKRDKKQTEMVILKSGKAENYLSHYDKVDGDVIRESTVANNAGKHIKFCHQQELKRSPRDVSCLGWMLMEEEPHDTRGMFLYRAAGKQYRPHRNLKYVVKRRSQFHRPTHRHFYRLSRSELLPSYSLNVNSNAGIFELGPDGAKASGGKQPSCTSVHSTEQYYSIHTDTPDAKIMDSDAEVSPAFSLTEEIVDKHNESNVINGSEQNKHLASECEGRRENESSRHKKSNETASAEETHGDTQIASTDNSNQKKKTKTTEALYIKFESSMSKKVTTTTVLKDGRRASSSKFRADSQKQLSLPIDSQKAVLGLVDNKSTADNPRYTKIIRYSDHYDNAETKSKQCCNVDPITGKEGRLSGNAHSHEARSVSPDQRCHSGKSGSTSRTRYENSTLQGSPRKPSSESCSRDHKNDTTENSFTLERESSAATIVNIVPSSPVRHGSVREHSAKSELGRPKKTDSPNRERSNSQEKKEHTKRTNSQEKKEHTKQTAATHMKASISRADHRPRAEARSASKTHSPRSVRSPQTESNSAKQSLSRCKRSGNSPVDRVSRSDSKKLTGASRRKTKSSDDFSSKGDTTSESSKSHPPVSERKRSQTRVKTLPRSPDTKRKRRSVKKDSDGKSMSTGEDCKQDKYKKQKMNEKLVKKKKKQKQQKQMSGENDDSIERQRPPKKKIQPLKSRSSEFNKNTQTLSTSLSAPLLDDTRCDILISSIDHCPNRIKEESRTTIIKERQSIGDDILLSLDNEYTSQGREVRIRSCAFSAENVSIATSGSKSIRCAESVPTFTGTVYKAMTKVVQVAACSKNKKTEKDLQRAELGWNSSTISPEEKVVADKKQNKKLSKMRYYIVKPRTGKGNKESGNARNRCAAQKESVVLGSAGEADDIVQLDKLKLGQSKSVQFSDNIEDLEAMKNDIGHDKAALGYVTVSNNIQISPLSSLSALQPPNKSADGEQPTANKPPPPKKEETHQPTTPPRRKRPVWIKKSNKSKTSGKSATSIKWSSVLVPFKSRPESVDRTKPGSRFNVHLYYPVKKTIGSPMLSNLSLSDKRMVAYNSWINNVFLAAPMNKATRKLVAQTGSPVDIKEIIEGSSVDAADHLKKVLQDSGVRAANSVPYLGPQRAGNIEVPVNKRLKQNDEPRSFSVKRAKATKPQETGAARSISPGDSMGEQGALKNSELGDDSSTAKHANESDNSAGPVQKIGYSKLIGPGHQRKKDKKQGKRLSGNLPAKWPRGVRSRCEITSLPNLPHGHYYGDTPDINVLNVGLNWMVQRVFRKLPFLHTRNAQSSANASGDTSLNQPVVQ